MYCWTSLGANWGFSFCDWGGHPAKTWSCICNWISDTYFSYSSWFFVKIFLQVVVQQRIKSLRGRGRGWRRSSKKKRREGAWGNRGKGKDRAIRGEWEYYEGEKQDFLARGAEDSAVEEYYGKKRRQLWWRFLFVYLFCYVFVFLGYRFGCKI